MDLNTHLGDSVNGEKDDRPSTGFGRGWFFNEGIQTPRVGQIGHPRTSSSQIRVPCGLQSPQTTSSDLSNLISGLADQIGHSIAAQLRGNVETSKSVPTENSTPTHGHSELNLSGVKLVMQSDVKEPPVFRGDSSDKCPVREWVDLMSMYCVKRNIPVQQQSQEILSRLMGRAKDVVKITLRNSPSLNHIQTPELIFDILKQHYGELTYSSMPMADFYNTKPVQHEGVMEYWIRLNNAIDIAVECLQRQGRSVEDPGREVTLMFIKYCPDPILSNRLSFKAAEEWSTSEVQERIDSFLRELRTRSDIGYRAQLKHAASYTQTAILSGTEDSQSAQISLTAPPPTNPQCMPLATPSNIQTHAPASSQVSQLSIAAHQNMPSNAVSVIHYPTQTPAATCSLPLTSQSMQFPKCQPVTQFKQEESQATPANTVMDGSSMQALINLLNRIMANQGVTSAPQVSTQQVPNSFQKRNCRVCGDTSHTTLVHCRKDRLCLSCFSPSHFKRDCNRHNQRSGGPNDTSPSQPQGN